MQAAEKLALQNLAAENVSQIRHLGTVSVDSIRLEADDIKHRWAAGILNDVAYVHFALEIDKRMYKSMTSLDYLTFAERWCFIGGDGTGLSSKLLKTKQIRDAIHKLEAAEFIEVEQQLSLSLNY